MRFAVAFIIFLALANAGYAQAIFGGGVTAPYPTSTTISVGTTSTALTSGGQFTKSLQVCTLPSSTTNVWLNPTGGAAAVNSGIPVFAGGGCADFGTVLPIPAGNMTAITDGNTAQTVVVAGG